MQNKVYTLTCEERDGVTEWWHLASSYSKEKLISRLKKEREDILYDWEPRKECYEIEFDDETNFCIQYNDFAVMVDLTIHELPLI